jgi:hypothetical protein
MAAERQSSAGPASNNSIKLPLPLLEQFPISVHLLKSRVELGGSIFGSVTMAIEIY